MTSLQNCTPHDMPRWCVTLGYGIVIRVLSTSQCSAVLPSQYKPPLPSHPKPSTMVCCHISDELKRWLFPCLFRVFMIQISVNTQESVNSCSSSSTAPIAGTLAGADSLVTTRIVIQYYSDNMNIFPILSDPQTWNFLRAAQGSHGTTLWKAGVSRPFFQNGKLG